MTHSPSPTPTEAEASDDLLVYLRHEVSVLEGMLREARTPRPHDRRRILDVPARALRRAISGVAPTRAKRWARARRLATDAGGVLEVFSGGYPQPTTYDVVCLPIIEWDDLHQRPQQLARQFAAHGHRVFYVSSRFRSDGPPVYAVQRDPNLWTLSLRGPAGSIPYRDQLSRNEAESVLGALEPLRLDAGMRRVVLLVQLPYWGRLAFAARRRHGWSVVYDCMDDHAGFGTSSARMLAEEEFLVRDADLVVVTASRLHEKVAPVARRVALVTNGVDEPHFRRAAGGTAQLPGMVVGYYGTISSWFDTSLVAEAARRRPSWQFRLIGDAYHADLRELTSLPNVFVLGRASYETLPYHLRRFDVACIPFRINPLTEATDPVKLYEYLRAGKPVVATALPALQRFGDLVYTVSSAREFVAAAERAVAEDAPDKVAARVAFARDNTWERRYEQLHRELRAAGLDPVVRDARESG